MESMIIDIVFAAILVGSIAIGAGRGAFKAISGIVGTVAGFIAAFKLGETVTPMVAKVITPVVRGAVKAAAKSQGVEEILESQLTRDILDMFGRLLEALGLGGELGTAIQSQAQATGEQVVDAVTQGLTGQIAPVLAFLLIFLAARGVVTLVLGLLSWDRIPIISSINRLGGALLGALSGAAIVLVLCWGVLNLAPAEGVWGLSHQTLRDSYVGSVVSGVLDAGA